MDITEDVDDVLANQLAIAKQSVDDRNRQIQELQLRVQVLEQMLNRAVSQASGVPAPQALPAYKSAPRRWTVR